MTKLISCNKENGLAGPNRGKNMNKRKEAPGQPGSFLDRYLLNNMADLDSRDHFLTTEYQQSTYLSKYQVPKKKLWNRANREILIPQMICVKVF